MVHRAAGHADEVVLGLLREPGDFQGWQVMPDRLDTARVVTHSTAADEDSPAPDGTVESSARSNPETSWPASRNAQTAPNTYPAHDAAAGVSGSSRSRATVCTASGRCAETTLTTLSVLGAAAMVALASMAKGSTRPPV